MGSTQDKTPLVVVVGETASGKSALALDLAIAYDGEIICADSRTVYKDLDIGTAKPSSKDQMLVPHHLLDIVLPDQKFSAADFKGRAIAAIDDISSRGKVPIMVGGTGLYVDSVLYDYQFSVPGAERDEQNPRHLKRNNELHAKVLRINTLMIGLQVPRTELETRIKLRVEQMFAYGLLNEAKIVSNRYGWQAPGLQTIGYTEFAAVFTNEQTFEQAIQQIEKNTMAYAKRQRTWFKRNKSIQWVTSTDQAKSLVQNFLSKTSSSA